ncbi:hypothetical protein HQ560_14320, partial [bacterium]|nr:hypothetical protein [bacterium]
RDLLALALLEVHAKTPDRTKAMAALARAAEAGVDVSRHKALLAPPKQAAPPPRPKPASKPQPIELHVAVRVDGVSELVLTPGAMHWEHKTWSKPGSRITVNGKPITLLWQGGSNTGRPVPVASVPTKLAAYEARVEKMGGRGRVTLSEAPAGQVVIRFDDGAHGGADDYEARLVLIPRLRTRR